MSTLDQECGRELKAFELKEKSVVIIQPPAAEPPVMMTMWVWDIDRDRQLVCFHSATLGWMVLNHFDDAGTIYDGQERVVKVFEYLGEI